MTSATVHTYFSFMHFTLTNVKLVVVTFATALTFYCIHLNLSELILFFMTFATTFIGLVAFGFDKFEMDCHEICNKLY